jgi:nucleotide-binding universal stress UspA family protein
VVICYDGSPESEDALAYVASLLPGAKAVVVSVFKPIVEEVLTVSLGPPPAISDPAEANEREWRAFKDLARDGARRATARGLDAEGVVVEATGPLWEAVVEAAEERDARLIACGTARSGLKSGLPGNLATTLVNHAPRAVLAVPSAKAAGERRRDLAEH